MMNKQNGIVIKSYTHKELAALYGVSWLTFQKWLKPFEEAIGIKNGHFYNTRQVEIIFEKLGFPSIDVSEDT
jgi:transposase